MTPIEELLERDAIKNVRIMYSHYFDMGDLDNLASLFLFVIFFFACSSRNKIPFFFKNFD